MDFTYSLSESHRPAAPGINGQRTTQCTWRVAWASGRRSASGNETVCRPAASHQPPYAEDGRRLGPVGRPGARAPGPPQNPACRFPAPAPTRDIHRLYTVGWTIFLQEHPQWNHTTRTIYRGWSQTYQDFLASHSLAWQAVRLSDLEDFHQQLLWTPNGHGGLQSSNTIYKGMRLLRTFYRWAVRSQLISVSPMDGWVLSRPACHPRTPLTWEETQQLFRGPDLGQPSGHRDLLLLHLIYQGLPLRECRHLDIESEVPVEDTPRGGPMALPHPRSPAPDGTPSAHQPARYRPGAPLQEQHRPVASSAALPARA